MSSPRVLVRADGGPGIGMGHVERSVAVARAIGETTLLCSAPEGLATWADDRGIRVAQAPHAEPLQGLAAAASRRRADVVLVDHPSLRDSDNPALAAIAARRLLVSFGNRHRRRFVEQVVINANALATRLDYAAAPGQRCDFLLGPGYFPLRSGLLPFLRPATAQASRIRSLVLCLGGADPLGLTPTLLRACAALPEAQVTAIVGPAVDDRVRAEAQRVAEAHPALRVEPPRPEIAPLLAAADLAVIGAGGMVSECMALAVPVLAIAQNRDQAVHMEPLVAESALVLLDGRSRGLRAQLAEVLRRLDGDPDGRGALAFTGRRLVDGEGAARCAAAITARWHSRTREERAA